MVRGSDLFQRLINARNGIYIRQEIIQRTGLGNDATFLIIEEICRARFAQSEAVPVGFISENPDLIIGMTGKCPPRPYMVNWAGSPKSIYLLEFG